jgi:hypothetical protein
MIHKAVTVAEVAAVEAAAKVTMATMQEAGVLDTLLFGGTLLEDLSNDVLGKSRK